MKGLARFQIEVYECPIKQKCLLRFVITKKSYCDRSFLSLNHLFVFSYRSYLTIIYFAWPHKIPVKNRFILQYLSYVNFTMLLDAFARCTVKIGEVKAQTEGGLWEHSLGMCRAEE